MNTSKPEWVSLGKGVHILFSNGVKTGQMTQKDSVKCSKCRGRLLSIDVGMGFNGKQCIRCGRRVIN